MTIPDKNNLLKEFSLVQNRKNFYLSIIEICYQLYCSNGKRFIKHLVNHYYLNSSDGKNINFQINITNPKIKDFSFDILLHILQFNERLLIRAPYNVKISSYLKDQIDSMGNGQLINDIKLKLEKGDSVKKYYSNKLFNAFNKESSRKFEDLLLKNLSIRHLHLTPKNRKDEILIYYNDGRDILMLGIFKHSLFDAGEGLLTIISILENDFPEFLKKNILNGIEGDDLTESMIFDLSQKNCSFCLTTKYGGLTLNNAPRLLLMSEFIRHHINSLCDNIFEILGVVPYKYFFSDELKLFCQLEPNKNDYVQINLNDKHQVSNILNRLVILY